MTKLLEGIALLAGTVFVVVVIGLAVIYSSPPSGTPTNQQTNEQRQPENNNSKERKSFWQKTTDDPIAFFTLWLVVFTGILGAVSVIQLNLLRRAEITAIVSANAAKMAADAALASNRPWVIAKFVVTNLEKTAAGLNIGTNIELINIGNSPALNVFVSARFIQEEGDILSGLDIQKEVCHQVSLVETVSKSGIVVFPKLATFSNQVAVATVTEGKRRFYLTGCIAYMFAGSQEVHQTGFFLGLSDGKSITGGVPQLVTIDIPTIDVKFPDIVVAKLSLNQLLLGAFAN